MPQVDFPMQSELCSFSHLEMRAEKRPKMQLIIIETKIFITWLFMVEKRRLYKVWKLFIKIFQMGLIRAEMRAERRPKIQ